MIVIFFKISKQITIFFNNLAIKFSFSLSSYDQVINTMSQIRNLPAPKIQIQTSYKSEICSAQIGIPKNGQSWYMT